MQVKELIERLSCMDGEAEVRFSYNYGDHWKTAVAQHVFNVEEGRVEYSEYHGMDVMVDDSLEYEDDVALNVQAPRVVVLS